jgi:hypothetical protein
MPAIPGTDELNAWYEGAAQAPPPVMGATAVQGYKQAEHFTDRANRMRVSGSLIGSQVAQAIATEKLGEVDAELFTIQDGLRKLTVDQRAKLNDYLANVSSLDPKTLNAPDYVAILTEHPNRLRNFLTWHTKHLAEQQNDPDFHGAVETYKQRFTEATEWGVQHGWLSSSMLSGNAAVEQSHVLIGDIWDTSLSGNQGYHEHGSPNVVIAQSEHAEPEARSQELAERLAHGVAHEYVHLALDTHGSWLPRWLCEGRAEHIKLSLHDKSGQSFALVDPAWRAQQGVYEKQTYVKERQLIATLLHAGGEQVDPRLFTLGTSANGRNSVNWVALEQTIDHAWDSHDMLGWVSERIEHHEQSIRDAQEKAQATNPQAEQKTGWMIQDEALDATRKEVLDFAAHLREPKTPQHVGAAVHS